MKNSDCVYATLLRLKVVVPGSTMAPFPPVTGPVTEGLAAEGRGRRAPAACADAAATPSRDPMVTAAAMRASQRRVLVMLRTALIAGTFHDGPGLRGLWPRRVREKGNATTDAGQAPFSRNSYGILADREHGSQRDWILADREHGSGQFS